jgi:signal transduction histidine kinase
VQRIEQWEQWNSDRIAQVGGVWTRFRLTMVCTVSAFSELVLWRAGYPIWRLATSGLLFAALIALAVLADWAVADGAATRAGIGHREQLPAIHRWGLVLGLSFHILIVGLTGGVQSPMLVGVPAMLAVIAIQHGWSRVTQVASSLMVAAVVAMALLPRAWLGPPMPTVAFALLAVATVIASAGLAVGHIITLMERLEMNRRALNRAREQLISQMYTRARELEQMGAQLSHELKNPLQAIGILVQLSARDISDPEARERLQVAEAEVERMDSIIKEYLSFSRPFDKLQPKKVALGAMADEVIAVLEPGASAAGVLLRRSGEAQAEADPRRIREALHNLISNGLEACAKGGRVEIEISERDSTAQIAVRDSGCGMSRSVLERLGTAFFTTRPEGTGLGVVMARAAFTQHGGALVYQSEEGGGTTVIGTLPLRQLQRTEHGARAAG